jgi:GrpB-like predicted nucleotidyltransferase (UPF0157 family)
MLKLYPFKKNFDKIFNAEKKKISEVIGNFKIHHIGSTAVKGLGGKGIIDIMIVLDNWRQAPSLIKKLKSIGFTHIHEKEKGRIFLNPKAKTSFADSHLHVVIFGSKPHRQLLAFRNRLRHNKKTANQYWQLKRQLAGESRNNRLKYTKDKGDYIKRILAGRT